MHQGHVGFLEADNKGHNFTSINVKGQAVGIDGTVQQLLKEGVDGLEQTKDLPSSSVVNLWTVLG